MIANKWKRFAISQVFSDWYEHINLDDFYDDMILEDEDGLTELFEDNDVIVWEVFENLPLTAVAEYIQNLAQSAQDTESDDERNNNETI